MQATGAHLRTTGRTSNDERRYVEMLRFVAITMIDEGNDSAPLDDILSAYAALSGSSLSEAQKEGVEQALLTHPNFQKTGDKFALRIRAAQR